MRISDWSSDVCSSDLHWTVRRKSMVWPTVQCAGTTTSSRCIRRPAESSGKVSPCSRITRSLAGTARRMRDCSRSEEHTSELQSLMRISYAVFCLKKKKQIKDSSYVVQHSKIIRVTVEIIK